MVDVLAHVPALVAYWGNDLRNVFANEAYSEWFGKPLAEIRGMHDKDLLGPELFAQTLPYLRAVLAGRSQTFVRTVADSAGRTRVVQMSYTPHVVDGVVQGFFALGTDITGRVEAETAAGENAKQVAASDERERIESTLHATVFQRLFAASLELDAATRPGTAGPTDRIRAAVDGIHAAITELREAVRASSAPLEFTAAMDQIVRRVAAALGFEAERTYTGALDSVPIDTWAELLTVLNEALFDAGRHAAASHVDIVITAHPDRVELRVADDGPAPHQPERAAALASLRARAEHLGGTLTWQPTLPSGTIIQWQVPITGTPTRRAHAAADPNGG